MSSSVGTSTNNQLTVNRNTAKIFVRDNRYQEGNYINNSSYDPLTLVKGTVMARLNTTGGLTPWISTGTNGEKYPIGILAQDVTLDASESKAVTIVDAGDVVQDQLVFTRPADGIETIVDSRRLKDWLQAMNIKLVGGTDMTKYDND